MASTFSGYEPVIGLEVHAQLLTQTKTFCGCATSFGDPPNTHTCPVCLGLPGALPVLNEEAVRMAMSAALALGCAIQNRSVFARKNYFYPDLPKGYQISQYDLPLAVRGGLEIDTESGKRRVGILRVHMEEDAGKNLHGMGGDSIVDLNRAGTPLIEIVGDPDLRSGAEAAEYLKRLREILMFIGVNDGNLEQGSFRCDANVSVRKIGETRLGTRAELKNINSFRFVADAIEIEARRQVELLERGERVRQQTRGYNADKKETYVLRDKENESGYRYFPEPDLPPLLVDAELVATVRAALQEPPAARRRRMVEELGLTPYAAAVLTTHPQIAAFFDASVQILREPLKIANFIQSEVLRDVRTTGLTADFPVSPLQVAELLRLVDQGTISGKQAKEVYAVMRGTHEMPASIVRARGMTVISDEAPLEELAKRLVTDNEKQAASYRGGKLNLLGFFVGQMMKQTGGSASPAVVNAVLKRVLDGSVAAGEKAPGAERAPVAGAEKAIETQARPSPETLPGLPRPITMGEARPVTMGEAPIPPARPVPAILPPRMPPSEREVRSPLARSVAPEPRTLTSASGVDAVTLPPTPGTGAPPPAPASIEVLDRLDLRVGVIVKAERVQRKDRLLDLAVDVGDPEGPRRIVAGLALSFAPEELVGRRVIVACNLEPRSFGKDLISRGMILAAGPSESLALTTVSKEVSPGTRVK